MHWLSNSNSPAPCTFEWLARICSTKLVPERGIPRIKRGLCVLETWEFTGKLREGVRLENVDFILENNA